jgi:hypothetical protein
MAGPDQLSAAQREVYDKILAALPAGNVFELRCKAGRGRSTILTHLHAAVGRTLLTVRDFVDSLSHAMAIDDSDDTE